jgi:hypothetical protein
MGYAVPVDSKKLKFSVDRLVQAVQDYRKDEVVIDFSRQTMTRFAEVVAKVSSLEGNPVSAHNNKTSFLEGIDIWFRRTYATPPAPGDPGTSRARDIIVHVMTPWYEAMDLEDPSKWNGRLTPPPAYDGDPTDAVAIMLGACACLEIYPLRFCFGMDKDDAVYVWGMARADGRWYDCDIMNPSARIGDRPKFGKIEEVEIPL